MFENIKGGLIFGITASFVILFTGVLYSAWENVSKVSENDTLQASEWNKMVDDLDYLKTGVVIPSGLVAAFDSIECPSGWSKADGSAYPLDLRGEFIRGLDDGRGIDSGRSLGSSQLDAFETHTHSYHGPSNSWSVSGAGGVTWTSGAYSGPAQFYIGAPNSGRYTSETRPRNVALLYCVKN